MSGGGDTPGVNLPSISRTVACTNEKVKGDTGMGRCGGHLVVNLARIFGEPRMAPCASDAAHATCGTLGLSHKTLRLVGNTGYGEQEFFSLELDVSDPHVDGHRRSVARPV